MNPLSPPDALSLTVLPVGAMAVCRLPPDAPLPEWALAARGFVSLTRTSDELSIVCPETLVPAGVQSESGFGVLKVQGPLSFDATGIIARLATTLAAAGISVLTVATYETDYLLVKEGSLVASIAALRGAGYRVTP
jgi:hypothetical protein